MLFFCRYLIPHLVKSTLKMKQYWWDTLYKLVWCSYARSQNHDAWHGLWLCLLVLCLFGSWKNLFVTSLVFSDKEVTPWRQQRKKGLKLISFNKQLQFAKQWSRTQNRKKCAFSEVIFMYTSTTTQMLESLRNIAIAKILVITIKQWCEI